ncbi:hypothetical protein [Bradyrhizobium sp. Tv2a-2]|uniref:hypothetical protein n=1 Tax=Bradyrhizobium sp. Tv2a-2 TaxID=113395 RepID=UPI0012EB263F|nr:hypothetical protein [Bradyrhizobium sp. Tv2a-2]
MEELITILSPREPHFPAPLSNISRPSGECELAGLVEVEVSGANGPANLYLHDKRFCGRSSFMLEFWSDISGADLRGKGNVELRLVIPLLRAWLPGR